MQLVMLELIVLGSRRFHCLGLCALAADEDGERTGNFSKAVGLARGLDIASSLTFTTPSSMRSTPGTTGAERPSRPAKAAAVGVAAALIRGPEVLGVDPRSAYRHQHDGLDRRDGDGTVRQLTRVRLLVWQVLSWPAQGPRPYL